MMKQMAIEKQNEQAEWERRDGSVLTKTKSGRGYKPGGQYLKSDHDL